MSIPTEIFFAIDLPVTGMTTSIAFIIVVSIIGFILMKIVAKTMKMIVFFIILAIIVIGAGSLMYKHSGPDEAKETKPATNKKRR